MWPVGFVPTVSLVVCLTAASPGGEGATPLHAALHEGNAVAAVEQYRLLLQSEDPAAGETARLRLGQYSYALGEYEEALGYLEQVRADSLIPEAQRWRALTLFAMGRYDDAAHMWEQLLNRAKHGLLALEARAGVADCLWHLGLREKAADHYLELSKSSDEWALPAWPLYRLAQHQSAEGRDEVAWELHRMLADRYPSTPEAAMARGVLADLEQEAAEPRYAVQVGAFSQVANARSLLDSLEGAGYRARVVPVLVGETRLSAVRVGEFAHDEEAAGLQEELKLKMGLEGRVVVE
jgi:tetratricopeptide (TPR) repeat protein